jgi:hypothetical protein
MLLRFSIASALLTLTTGAICDVARAQSAFSISDPSPDPGYLAAYAPLSSPPADPQPTASRPSPKSQPSLENYERPDKWQFGVSFALVRFRSPIYFASAPGMNSSLAYSWKEWLAIEGSVTSAFAPAVFEDEHFRYLGLGGGPKIIMRHGRFEPWTHVLAGVAHLVPQTASSGRNSLEITSGLGTDYNINSIVSARLGIDYLRTRMFGESQNSASVAAGFAVHF